MSGNIMEKPVKKRDYGGFKEPNKVVDSEGVNKAMERINPALLKDRSSRVELKGVVNHSDFEDRETQILSSINHPQDTLNEYLSPGMRIEIGVLDGWVDETHCLFDGFQTKDIKNDSNVTDNIIGIYDRDDCKSPAAQMDIGRDHGSHVLSLIGLMFKGGETEDNQFSLHVSADQIGSGTVTFEALHNTFVKRFEEGVIAPRVFNISATGLHPGDSDGLSKFRRRVVESRDATLFVFAAGNEGAALNPGSCVFEPPCFAADSSVENVINVAALQDDELLSLSDPLTGNQIESNFGSVVHVAAPGNNLVGASFGNRVGQLSGTSQAAPLVAATAAMLMDRNHRERNPMFIKDRIMYTSDLLPSLKEKQLQGGRLNVANAIREGFYFEKLDGVEVVGEKLAADTRQGFIRIFETSTGASCFVNFKHILRLSRVDTGAADDNPRPLFEIFLRNPTSGSIFFATEDGVGDVQSCDSAFPRGVLARKTIRFPERLELQTVGSRFTDPAILEEDEQGFTGDELSVPLSDLKNYIRDLNYDEAH